MPEVQRHGFSWQTDLLCKVYGATENELKAIKDTSKMDLPGSLNRKDGADLSVKTTCSENSVCMADCLRIYDAVSSGTPLHMTVIYYIQNDETKTKKLASITEVDLTNSVRLLFGSITRAQIEELDKTVKAVPQKRSPTKEEHEKMYAMRNAIQEYSGAIHLDIKCNSQQSRLQCSFNKFQKFLTENPDRMVAASNTCEFRGATIIEEIASERRTFKRSLPESH